MWLLLQSPPTPTVEAWQVVALLGSIALVVLGAYGTLIIQNRTRVNSLRQRLFGADADGTDDGFVQDTEKRLDTLAEKQEQHARLTHSTLYGLDRKLNVVLDVVRDKHDGGLPREVRDVEDVPPPPGDFYRGGNSGRSPRGPPDEGDRASDD